MLKRLVVLVAFVCACTPAAPAPATTSAAATPPAKGSVTVNYGCSTAGAINGPVYIAEEYGYFAEQGITLNYVLFPSASEVIPSITRGDVDVAAIGINPATLNALAANFGIKLVADTGTQFPGFPLNIVVVTNEMAGIIKRPADLKGHKIALTPPGMGTASGFLLSKYLAQGGPTVNDVDVVPLTFQDQVAALTNRSVDAAFDLPSIAAAQEYFKGLGLVQVTPDPATLVNTSFAQEAVKQLGPGAAPVPPKPRS